MSSSFHTSPPVRLRQNDTPAKLRKTCDNCVQRRYRCNGQNPCNSCTHRLFVCRYSYFTRRKIKPGDEPSFVAQEMENHVGHDGSPSISAESVTSGTVETVGKETMSSTWKFGPISSESLINNTVSCSSSHLSPPPPLPPPPAKSPDDNTTALTTADPDHNPSHFSNSISFPIATLDIHTLAEKMPILNRMLQTVVSLLDMTATKMLTLMTEAGILGPAVLVENLQGLVQPALINSILCFATQLYHSCKLQTDVLFDHCRKYFVRAEYWILRALENSPLDTVTSLVIMTLSSCGLNELKKLSRYAEMGQRLMVQLDLHLTDSPFYAYRDPRPSTLLQTMQQHRLPVILWPVLNRVSPTPSNCKPIYIMNKVIRLNRRQLNKQPLRIEDVNQLNQELRQWFNNVPLELRLTRQPDGTTLRQDTYEYAMIRNNGLINLVYYLCIFLVNAENILQCIVPPPSAQELADCHTRVLTTLAELVHCVALPAMTVSIPEQPLNMYYYASYGLITALPILARLDREEQIRHKLIIDTCYTLTLQYLLSSLFTWTLHKVILNKIEFYKIAWNPDVASGEQPYSALDTTDD
ncbi:hypothetical protein IWQ61_004999 [Dispira simplex]|nr:hypothetical protein IWQ61_004999 [Dispira simplex]